MKKVPGKGVFEAFRDALTYADHHDPRTAKFEDWYIRGAFCVRSKFTPGSYAASAPEIKQNLPLFQSYVSSLTASRKQATISPTPENTDLLFAERCGYPVLKPKFKEWKLWLAEPIYAYATALKVSSWRYVDFGKGLIVFGGFRGTDLLLIAAGVRQATGK